MTNEQIQGTSHPCKQGNFWTIILSTGFLLHQAFQYYYHTLLTDCWIQDCPNLVLDLLFYYAFVSIMDFINMFCMWTALTTETQGINCYINTLQKDGREWLATSSVTRTTLETPPLEWELNRRPLLHMPHTATYAPRHKVGKAPVVLLVKEQVADTATERFLIVLVIYNLEHCLRVTRPRPGNN